MKWRVKALVMLFGSLFLVLTAFVVIEFWIVSPAVEKQELEQMERKVESLSQRVQQRLEKLEVLPPELYRSPAFAALLQATKENTKDLSQARMALARNECDFLLVLDSSGQVIAKSYQTREVERKLDLLVGQMKRLGKFRSVEPGSSIEGAVPFDAGLILFSLHGIAPEKEGTGVRSIVVGKFDATPFRTWLRAVGLTLECGVYERVQGKFHGKAAYEPSRYVVRLDEKRLAGRLLLLGLGAESLTALDVEGESSLYAAHRDAFGSAFLALTLLLFLTVSLIWIAVDVFFLRRFETFTLLVDNVSTNGSTEPLENFRGADEVGLLARRTGLMARNLREARELAVAGDRAKANFLAMISQELRTPINGILGFGRLLKDTQPNQEQQELIQGIEECGQHLQKLIDDMLLYSKLEPGSQSLHQRDVETRDLLDDLHRFTSAELDSSHQRFEMSVGRDFPKVLWTDHERLRQALLNILSNAIKFTPEGLIRIEANLVKSGSGHPQVEFVIADTGVGISPELLPMLFRPFNPGIGFQARPFQGTGLGLAIAHRLLKSIGGSVSVESIQGKGSTFTVRLPVLTPESR